MAVIGELYKQNRRVMAATIAAGFLFLCLGCSVPQARHIGTKNNYWKYRYSQKKTDVSIRAYRPKERRFPK